MRIVFDSNVLLAAFGSRGLCEALFSLCIRTHDVFISEHILQKVEHHLAGKFGLTPGACKEIARYLRQHCQVIKPEEIDIEQCRDPQDLPILGTAVSAHADYLVSGDKDLLVLKVFQTIPIVSPRQLYEAVR